MNKIRLILMGVLVMGAVSGWGQEVLDPKNIPTLNRIAGEYDFWKWIFGILTVLISVWSFVGLRFFLKTKVNEWIDNEIAKKAGLKIEDLKSALAEYAHNAKLKQKKICVISAAEGQQANVKKVFDGCGFIYDENCWVDIAKVPALVLGNVDILLFNDQTSHPLSVDQIESVMEKFKTNVAYFYFGDKRLKSDDYRKEYKIDLDFCNSASRLEAGLLSILKIR